MSGSVSGEELLAYALDKPGAWPDQPWEEHTVAKVGAAGSIFAFMGDATIGLESGRTRDEADELIDRLPDHVAVMAYIGRHGWNTIRLDAPLSPEEWRELVDASYDDVVARLPRNQRLAADP